MTLAQEAIDLGTGSDGELKKHKEDFLETAPYSTLPWMFYEYFLGAAQRSLMTMETFRKRGDMAIKNKEKFGNPPVLDFPYQTIIDGKTLKRPVNFSLCQIFERREDMERRSPLPNDIHVFNEKRGNQDRRDAIPLDTNPNANQPVLVVDPRAGHGPGVAGTKQDSIVGIALRNGHPVYFLSFTPNPTPGQTIADVIQAQVKFLRIIQAVHGTKPFIIGNCQGGWASAILVADNPKLANFLVLNAAPLSYWAGDATLTQRGMLLGGSWIVHFLNDLFGRFDGANLILNFEMMNLANTLLEKNFNLYSKIDTEEQRFLTFEGWWQGIFCMTPEEIEKIIDGLFIGNELEQGLFQLEPNNFVDLKNITCPIVIFASHGDAITPIPQAYGWIPKLYKSTGEIKKRGKVIVYLQHQTIGHLGIFVGSKVAKKEHKNILGHFKEIESLEPGLWEMIIGDSDDVRFEERSIQDIIDLDDSEQNEDLLANAARISKQFSEMYDTFFRPVIRQMAPFFPAQILEEMHPMRTQHHLSSNFNPLLQAWLTQCTDMAKKYRQKAHADNTFLQHEKMTAKTSGGLLGMWDNWIDANAKLGFQVMYGPQSPWSWFSKLN